MVKYETFINGNLKTPLSVSFDESIEATPRTFNTVLTSLDADVADYNEVLVKRDGVIRFRGKVEEIVDSSGESLRRTASGRDITVRGLKKVISADERIGGEPADLIRFINRPLSRRTNPTLTWVEDAAPTGATETSDDIAGSGWDTTKPKTGTKSIHVVNGAGNHGYTWTGGTPTAVIPDGSRFFVYVWIPSTNTPTAIQVGVRRKSNTTFYNAFWGTTAPSTGAKKMGNLPSERDQWIRLDIRAVDFQDSTSAALPVNEEVDGFKYRVTGGESWCETPSVDRKWVVIPESGNWTNAFAMVDNDFGTSALGGTGTTIAPLLYTTGSYGDGYDALSGVADAVIDFQESLTLDAFGILMEFANPPTTFSIRLSYWDGAAWQTWITDTTSFKRRQKVGSSITTTKIRFEVTDSSINEATIFQLKLYTATDVDVFDVGTINTFGSEIQLSVGNYESRLNRFLRIADFIAWNFWIDYSTTKGRINFTAARGTDKSATIIFEQGVNAKIAELKTDTMEKFDRIVGLGSGQGEDQLAVTKTIPSPPSDIREVAIPEADIENLDLLDRRTQALLDELKNVKKRFKVTPYQTDEDFEPGDTIKVKITDLNFDQNVRVFKVGRTWDGSGESVDLEVEAEDLRVDELITQINVEIRRTLQYYGGFPSVLQFGEAENFDSTLPVKFRVRVPQEVRTIDFLKLDVFGEKWRAYSPTDKFSTPALNTTADPIPCTVIVPTVGDDHGVDIIAQASYTISEADFLSGRFILEVETGVGTGVYSTIRAYSVVAVGSPPSVELREGENMRNVNYAGRTLRLSRTVLRREQGASPITVSSGFLILTATGVGRDPAIATVYEGLAPTNVRLRVKDPDGNVAIIPLGTDEFIVSQFSLLGLFTKPGIYELEFQSDSQGRIRYVLYGQMFVGIRVG